MLVRFGLLFNSTHRPFSAPINGHIVYHGVQTSSNPIRLILRENNGTSVATLVESFEYVWDIIFLVPLSFDCANTRFALLLCIYMV